LQSESLAGQGFLRLISNRIHYIGLSRSLLAAGVPSAIVTQWAVPDAPTAALMTRFYEFLGQGLDKSAALRQATLATMQQYPDPINWAAFTLIGDTH
jgi:CHAT domain-containing protein